MISLKNVLYYLHSLLEDLSFIEEGLKCWTVSSYFFVLEALCQYIFYNNYSSANRRIRSACSILSLSMMFSSFLETVFVIIVFLISLSFQFGLFRKLSNPRRHLLLICFSVSINDWWFIFSPLGFAISLDDPSDFSFLTILECPVIHVWVIFLFWLLIEFYTPLDTLDESKTSAWVIENAERNGKN